jgi:hypothetical protein
MKYELLASNFTLKGAFPLLVLAYKIACIPTGPPGFDVTSVMGVSTMLKGASVGGDPLGWDSPETGVFS